MSLKIIVITKYGSITEDVVKNVSSDSDIIQKTYKKCGFKKVEDYILQCEFTVPDFNAKRIKVFGKKTGRATRENKYEFPPPLDNTILFGSCCLVAYNKSTNCYEDLTKKEWCSVYEKLFGGFEDLTTIEEEDSEDELENIDKRYLSNGYLVDGFVVDDVKCKNINNELSEDEYIDIDEVGYDGGYEEDEEDEDEEDEDDEDEDDGEEEEGEDDEDDEEEEGEEDEEGEEEEGEEDEEEDE